MLNRENEAREYITETEAQLAALSAEYGELISSIGATEAKAGPDFMAINALSSAGNRGVLGTILMSELGFRAPEEQSELEIDEYGTIELSQELVNLVDGDLLFLEVREGSKFHEESPLWDDLDVVENDAVYVVGNHWEFGGAVAARRVIADIAKALEDFAARNQSPSPTASAAS